MILMLLSFWTLGFAVLDEETLDSKQLHARKTRLALISVFSSFLIMAIGYTSVLCLRKLRGGVQCLDIQAKESLLEYTLETPSNQMVSSPPLGHQKTFILAAGYDEKDCTEIEDYTPPKEVPLARTITTGQISSSEKIAEEGSSCAPNDSKQEQKDCIGFMSRKQQAALSMPLEFSEGEGGERSCTSSDSTEAPKENEKCSI
mmetsp:Transcript_44726/g.65354  ORF Transcript_44726/g.65354 Transcript_44726/m.65354 type:complete len:202 (+) Transcript_44726:3-608(+)